MKIKYTFANGDISEIEVTTELGEMILELDRLEYNNHQRETRRHASLDGMDYEGEIFADGADIEADFLKALDSKVLFSAIAELLPQQQELLRKIFFESRSLVSIAHEESVSEAAIRNRLKKIYTQLQKKLQ